MLSDPLNTVLVTWFASIVQRTFSLKGMRAVGLEIFKIIRISSRRQPIVYYLEDLAGEEIIEFFYGEKLCKARKNLSTDVFEIEKI